MVSFAVGILVFRGRHILDVEGFPKRRFNLGKFGYVINVLALFFVIFTSVFFLFPPFIPVTAMSMNYVVVSVVIHTFLFLARLIRVSRFFAQCVIFLILGISGLTWIFKGKKHYTGPKDIDGLLALARYGLQLGQVVDEDAIIATHSEKIGQPVIKESVVV